MRFFLDHDVDAAVAAALRNAGHQAWTAASAGMKLESDDTLTVYAADKDAVLLTHDREFSQRRRRNVTGRHIWLRCDEQDAADLLMRHLDELLPLMTPGRNVFVAISHGGVAASMAWE